MDDLLLAGVWILVLAGGLAVTVGLRKSGLRASLSRDLLHVGAGVWVLGWPYWQGLAAPLSIGVGATVAIAVIGIAEWPWARQIRRGISEGDERFGGLVLYTLAFAIFTALGLTGAPFPAAAGLLALALGDGLGGLVGRHFGRRFYTPPGGQRKTLKGSAAVAVFGAAGVALAGTWFGVDLAVWQVLVLGVVAAAAEGIAPRSSDNALVPAAVWVAALLLV